METPARIAALMAVTVKDMDMSGPQRVEVKVQSGVRICGSGNVVLAKGERDSAGTTAGANSKTEAERNDRETKSECEEQKGTKRQAESVRGEWGDQMGMENMLTLR